MTATDAIVKETTPEVPAKEVEAESPQAKAPATEEKAPATEEKAPATEEKAPATEEKAPATEEKAPAAEVQDAETAPELTDAVKAKILRQLEYYFGDFNLPRDKFLREEIKRDDGWVPLTTMIKFQRLAKDTTDPAVIVSVIKAAEKTIMEVDNEGQKIRRSPEHPMPESEGLQEESVKRTIYVKGFPKDNTVTLDDLLEFFKAHGEYDSVRMRNYSCRQTNAQGFKGSVLVVFKTVELAKAFIEGAPTQHGETYLIKKYFAAYLEEKRQEADERKAKRDAKSNGNQQREAEIEEMPKGTFLKATGFAENTMREDIKAAVFDLTSDCAFVDFKKGEEVAFIRFSEAGSNVKILEAIKDTLKVNEAQITVTLVEGEEEDAQLQKAKDARMRSVANGGQHGGRNNKRKGNWGGRGGGRGRGNKRSRN